MYSTQIPDSGFEKEKKKKKRKFICLNQYDYYFSKIS